MAENPGLGGWGRSFAILRPVPGILWVPAWATKQEVSQKSQSNEYEAHKGFLSMVTAEASEILLKEVFILTASRLPPGDFGIELQKPFQGTGDKQCF